MSTHRALYLVIALISIGAYFTLGAVVEKLEARRTWRVNAAIITTTLGIALLTWALLVDVLR